MFSNSCKYALRAVLLLSTVEEGKPKMGAKKISESLGIPQPFLSKILQELSRKDIVSSVKGLHGGFYLSEKQLNMSLLNVVEAIDGNNTLASCVLGLKECSSENPCPIHFEAVQARTVYYKVFRDKKIKDLSLSILDANLRLA